MWPFKIDGLSKEVYSYSSYLLKSCDFLKWSPKKGWFLIVEVPQDGFQVLYLVTREVAQLQPKLKKYLLLPQNLK
jgi:hypothetical protein